MSDEPSATPRGASPRSRVARRRPSTTNLTIKIAGIAAAGALAIGAALGVQMASGSDPALGPKQAKSAATSSQSSADSSTASSSYPSPSGYSAMLPSTQASSAPAPVTSATS